MSLFSEGAYYQRDLCIDSPTHIYYANGIDKFTDIWNNKVGKDIFGRDTSIETVVIVGHGSSDEDAENYLNQLSMCKHSEEALISMKQWIDPSTGDCLIRDYLNLESKKISKLSLNICNGGAVFNSASNQVWYNMAETFLYTNDINKVEAWDGEIRFYANLSGIGNELASENNNKQGKMEFTKDKAYIYAKNSKGEIVSKKEVRNKYENKK